ncbi:receptor-like protein kinase FERONIA [Arachis duranensis]|uniref:Receptor-like protein kinase FERONIA n=1 Tax=Arachis duranensis TaxID=130453 RepID=A0A6P4CVD5_ARADU|nr:receptor-like protein kinase FERONIA [Arachis duranensis]
MCLFFRWWQKSSRDSSNPQNSTTCRHFTIAEIRSATNNFDQALIIGRGGFGNVYKGKFPKHRSPVAIKRLNQGSNQGLREFQTEIKMLSHLRHPHLVSLIGYCQDAAEMILVYDYMARGTLREHLYDFDSSNNQEPLSWNKRLEICLAAARGLHFLHTENVIHRDVKSTNILLDDDWIAKVADFGLSKDGPNGSHVTTDVKGSLGYLDPEYYMSQWLSQKSDVYSFGVVLLEVLCGRPVIKRRIENRQEESLVIWVKSCYQDGNVDLTVDPALKGTIGQKCLDKFVEVALSCLNDHGKERPFMKDVMKGLECALSLHLTGGKNNSDDVAVSFTVLVGHDYDDHSRGVVMTDSQCTITTTSSNAATTTTTTTTSTTTSNEEEKALVLHGVFSHLGNPTPTYLSVCTDK